MAEETSNQVDLGLALSGGTAKVIAHIGVLRALEEADLRPRILAGTSGGSLIAICYAAGLGPDELAALATEVNWKKLATIHLPKLGLLSSKRIEDFLVDLLGDIRFEDLKTPTRVVTCNLLTGAKTVFSKGRVAPVVRASCSIPQIFSPVEIDGGLYTDGGVIEYRPVETLLAAGAAVNVGVHLGAFRDFSQAPSHLVGMILRVTGLVASRNARASARLADVVLKPDLTAFGGFDLTRSEEMIDVGYETALRQIPRIRELLAESNSMWGKLKSKWKRAPKLPEEDEPLE